MERYNLSDALAADRRQDRRSLRTHPPTMIESLPQLLNVLCGEMSLIDRAGRSPSFLD
jgi:hypothetical protein